MKGKAIKVEKAERRVKVNKLVKTMLHKNREYKERVIYIQIGR